MNEIIISGGRVIDPISGLEGEHTITIRDGKIASIEKGKKKSGAKGEPDSGAVMIDATGMIVTPGFTDIHVHLREPGFEYKEDIESGSRAAVAGGFTTVCCMPNTDPVNDTASVCEYIRKRAASVALCRVLPVGAISHGLKGEALADIGDLKEAGAIAISDDGKPVMNSLLMRRAAEYASSFDLPIVDHCEDVYLSNGGVMNEGAMSTELGMRGIPAAAEEVQVARDIALAKLTGAHFHITHVSTAGAVELIRDAKKRKINITCDVTPHHLTLTEQALADYDTRFKVNPPLRGEKDVKELIRALNDGTIDCVATDHAPQGIVDKELGFDTAAFGMVGLETALPVMLKLVNEKKISLKKMVELLTCGINVLRKSASNGLRKGSVADVTIFDPEAKIIVDSSKFSSKSGNTPYEGWKLNGLVKFTIFEGKIVFDQDVGLKQAAK